MDRRRSIIIHLNGYQAHLLPAPDLLHRQRGAHVECGNSELRRDQRIAYDAGAER